MDRERSRTPEVEDVEDSRSATTSQQTDTDAESRTTAPRLLPPWKVLLHNDDVNIAEDVVNVILALTRLKLVEATRCMLEAHHQGVSLLLTTHRERAELYVHQFARRQLTVTAEPDERSTNGAD